MVDRRKLCRKQKVVWRQKERRQVNQKVRGTCTKICLFILCIAFFFLFWSRQGSIGDHWMQAHTPVLSYEAPERLSGIPWKSYLPKNTFWLWFSWNQNQLRKQFLEHYPEMASIRFNTSFLGNTIRIQAQPRRALVRWEDRAMDETGTFFTWVSASTNSLPTVNFPIFHVAQERVSFAVWLYQLSQVPMLWNNISTIQRNASGEYEMILKEGIHVLWGSIGAQDVSRKASTLVQVLNDAQRRWGRIGITDLRLFEEGRVIVQPSPSHH